MFVLGKDYDDNSDENSKIKGVMDGAPAYQPGSYLYVVPENVEKTVEEPEIAEKTWAAEKTRAAEKTWMAEKTGPEQEDSGEGDGAQVIWPSGDKAIEDYYALPDERRVELIDGVFYDMAAPSYIHQIIVANVWKCLEDFVEKNGGSCMPFAAPADVQLFCDSDKTMVQPDVFVVCNRDQITMRRLLGAPDLVIEVVSPDSRRRDAALKLRKYREAGVREYWIIFPEEKQVRVYDFECVRTKNGKEAAPRVYTFADKVPVGIWDGKCEVDFAEIYERCRFLYE